MVDVKQTLKRYKSFATEKSPWLIHYQVVAMYFLTRNADFTVNFTPGQFLNRDLFDSTGPKNANIMAGSLMGMLWPESSINFRLKPARFLPKTKEVKDYFDEISARLHDAMTETEAGLSMALIESMREGVSFGTSGVGVFDPAERDSDCHFLFQAWDVKRMVIAEGPNSLVNRIYYEREETVEQTVLEFGIDNVSEKTRMAYKNKDYDLKIRILHSIEPRYDRDPDGNGALDMPVSSTYIEMGSDKLLKESGYPSMRVFVHRFFKNIREKYGRSPAMDALPDVLELNALREAEIVATEKMLDPPLGIIDDGRLGASTIDTSAGAINVFNISGRVGNQPPVFPINTVGDMRPTKDRIEELKQSIADHFMIDRLLDMQNTTEMTLGEVMERQKMRAFVLNPIFSRWIREVGSPLIECCFNMLLDKGYLGVMPGSEQHLNSIINGQPVLVIPIEVAQAMLSGADVYDIEYLTPAARMMQTENVNGVLNAWKFANDIAQTQPEIYDNLDEDISMNIVAPGFGAPREILRDAETIAQIRNARAKQQSDQQQFQRSLDTAKAAGHLKGLMPQPGAPGVDAGAQGQPIQL